MLLAIDVGNTQTVLGLYDRDIDTDPIAIEFLTAMARDLAITLEQAELREACMRVQTDLRESAL